jgi:hypothetical protein
MHSKLASHLDVRFAPVDASSGVASGLKARRKTYYAYRMLTTPLLSTEAYVGLWTLSWPLRDAPSLLGLVMVYQSSDNSNGLKWTLMLREYERQVNGAKPAQGPHTLTLSWG